MRPSVRYLVGAFLYLAVAILSVPLYQLTVLAFRSGSPSAANIAGQPVCSGPPAAIGLLGFAGGQWCDNLVNVGMGSAFTPDVNTARTISSWAGQTNAILRRFTATLGTAPAACGTQAVINLRCNTVTKSTITFANGSATYDSGAIGTGCASPSAIDITIATAAAACGTPPANINFAFVAG